MKVFFHINLIFLLSILSSNTFAQNQIVADLSQENVKISTDFQGAKILLFGAYDGKKGDDIIVIVKGPKGLVTVQKKEKILGVWVNTRKVNYINAPKEAISIQTFYEKKYKKLEREITYLKFNFINETKR